MKIASWNVNSIRAREERLFRWLQTHQPDVLCLQELKAEEGQFPHEAVARAGYKSAIFGQRAYNGVAILAREEITDVVRGLGDGEPDEPARLLSAAVRGVRVVCAYVPNGQTVASPKWTYKLEWLRRLRTWLDARFEPHGLFALCGDFNVAPEPRDVFRPDVWEKSVLFHPEARAALRHVMDWGLTDSFRQHQQEGGFYSWWDYRALSFPKNDGLRLDLILLSAPLADLCRGASIDRQERKGQQPSDHVPVVAELDLP
jgi:exodeoxyribonuclease III